MTEIEGTLVVKAISAKLFRDTESEYLKEKKP
jgi:hypothetical protein